jgi:flagellar hook-length control protein FliK
MQTQTLAIQVSSASQAPARANGGANPDGGQFSQALSQEIGQRQAAASPAAPASPKPAAAPASPPETKAPAAEPGSAGSTAGAATSAAGGSAPLADGSASATAGSSDTPGADDGKDAAADAAAAAAAGPAVDMLALMASVQPPLQVPAGAKHAPAAELRGSAGAAAAASTAAVPAGAATLALPAAGPAGAADAVLGEHPAQGAKLGVAGQQASAEPAKATAFRNLMHKENGRLDPAAEPAGVLAGTPATAAARAAATELAAHPKAQPDLAQAARPQGGEGGADSLALAPAGASAAKEAPLAAPLIGQLQQASLMLAPVVNGAGADRLSARVGTPGWDNQLGQKIVWMVAGKEQSASLTLNPPDMGPMQVVLSVTNDQASVTFSSAQPEVRQALENALPRLREMMGESGLSLGNASVNAGMPEQRQAHGEAARPGSQGGGQFAGPERGVEAAARSSVRPATGGLGLVDTFA